MKKHNETYEIYSQFVTCTYAAICICNMQNLPNFFDCIINFLKQKH